MTHSLLSNFDSVNVRLADHIREVNISSPAFAAPQSAKRKQRAPDAHFSPDAGLSVPKRKVRRWYCKVPKYVTLILNGLEEEIPSM